VNVVERDWWAGPHGEALDRALNGLLDEDDAADVIALVQESFVPRAIHRGAVERAEKAERDLRSFQAGLTDVLRVYNVPAMPSWADAIHWLARKESS
jgi:hypothetical protein